MSAPALRMLALDAALNNIGYAVFDMPEFDVIEPVHGGLIQRDTTRDARQYKMQDDIDGSAWICDELFKLIDAMEPNAMAMELLNGSQSARTSTCFGIVTGIMGAVVQRTKLPLQLLVNTRIKDTFTGDKKASKDKMLETLLKTSPDFCEAFLPRPERKSRGKTAYVKHGFHSDAEHIVDAFAIGYTAASSKETKALFAMRQSLGT